MDSGQAERFSKKSDPLDRKSFYQCTAVLLFVGAIAALASCLSLFGVGEHFRDCDEKITDSHCSHQPCKNGGTCSISGDTYVCMCTEKFMGVNCEKDNLCFGTLCQNGGNCSVSGNSVMCVCPQGFSGMYCEVENNPCDSNPCQHGGSCSQVGVGYQCACASGFIGQNCEQGDPCSRNPCKNGGSCSVTNGNFHCQCPQSHYGKICENEGVEETECQKAATDVRENKYMLIGVLPIVCLCLLLLVALLIVTVATCRKI